MFRLPSPGISGKFILVSGFFLSIVTLYVAGGYHFSHSIQADGVTLAEVGELRFRVMRLSSLARDFVEAEPEDAAALKRQLSAERAEFSALLGEAWGESSSHDSEWYGDGKLIALSSTVATGWDRILSPNLDALLASERPESSAVKSFASLSSDFSTLLGSYQAEVLAHQRVAISAFDIFRIFFIGLMAFLSAFALFYVRKSLVMPIIELGRAAKSIAGNDLSRRVAARTSDEVGELAESFNSMAASLENSFAALREASKELLAVNESSNRMARMRESAELYRFLCESAREMFDLRMVWLGLVDSSSPVVRPVASAGMEADYLSAIRVTWDDSPTGSGPTGRCIKTGLTQTMDVTDSSFSTWRAEAEKRGYASSAATPLLVGDRCLGALSFYSMEPGFFSERRCELLQVFANHSAALIENAWFTEYVVYCLARAAEHNDEDTGNHILRVGEFCACVARRLALGDAAAASLRLQATLHDVGKIHVPAHILKKPGKLTEEEWALMRAHPFAGNKIIGEHPMLRVAGVIALTHHERWDGTGYPRGLSGEEIPIEGRIIAVADIYDALRSHRPYKPPFDHATATRIILEGDGRTMPGHFDPEVHRAFREAQGEFEAIYERLKG